MIEIRKENTVACECGNNSSIPEHEQRWHMDNFTHVQNLDAMPETNGTALYTCDECGKYCVSVLDTHPLAELKILGVSTGHITQDDAERLTDYAFNGSEDLPTRIMDDEYGTLIHCMSEDILKDTTENSEAKDALDELSEEFWNIYKAASAAGYDYILFDRDECEDPDWPTFEW